MACSFSTTNEWSREQMNVTFIVGYCTIYWARTLGCIDEILLDWHFEAIARVLSDVSVWETLVTFTFSRFRFLYDGFSWMYVKFIGISFTKRRMILFLNANTRSVRITVLSLFKSNALPYETKLIWKWIHTRNTRIGVKVSNASAKQLSTGLQHKY